MSGRNGYRLIDVQFGIICVCFMAGGRPCIEFSEWLSARHC